MIRRGAQAFMIVRASVTLLLIAVTLFGCAQRICHPDDGGCIEYER